MKTLTGKDENDSVVRARAGNLLEIMSKRSVKFGDFTLASGKKSDFFVDCKQSILTAEGHAEVGRVMFSAMRAMYPDVRVVAGVVLGGCPLASAVSFRSALDGALINALYVRKERKDHGSGQLVEGKEASPPGTRVVLLEDVITTGGSSLKSVGVLREEGYEVAGIIALVDRLEGGREAIEAAGIPLYSVFTKSDFLP